MPPHAGSRLEPEPTFLRGRPDDPELDRVVRAFVDGNFAHVRHAAPDLAERTKNPGVRRVCLDLSRRIRPDPMIAYLLGISVALLVFLMAYYYLIESH